MPPETDRLRRQAGDFVFVLFNPTDEPPVAWQLLQVASRPGYAP
jgi:hypothetical protein